MVALGNVNLPTDYMLLEGWLHPPNSADTLMMPMKAHEPVK